MTKHKKCKRYSRMSIFAMILGICLLSLYIYYKKTVLDEKLGRALEKKQYESHLYEIEQKRGEELDKQKIDSKTKKFIEDVARDKFGLAYKNEIIFLPENE